MSDSLSPLEDSPTLLEGSIDPIEPTLEPVVVTETLESDTALSGVNKAVLNFKLNRVNKGIQSLENPSVQARIRASNDAKLARNGRLAVINSGLAATYGARRGESGAIDPSTISDAKSRRIYEENARVIAENMAHIRATESAGARLAEEKARLEHKLGLRAPTPKYPTTKDPGPLPDSFESLANPNRNPLKGQSRTEAAVITALCKLIVDRSTVISESTLINILEDISGNSPSLAKFTLSKLRRLGIIDIDGRVLKAKSGLEEQLATYYDSDIDNRPRGNGIIEYEHSVSLSSEQLERVANLTHDAIAAYELSLAATSKTHRDKDIQDIEDGVIRSLLSPEATTKEIKKIKADVVELFERRAKIEVLKETRSQRTTRKAAEKARSTKEAEDAEAAEWAWAGEEKNPVKPTQNIDEYQALRDRLGDNV